MDSDQNTMDRDQNAHGKVNFEYEKIEISVTQSGQNVKFSHVTEVDHISIEGIAQVFSLQDALENSTLQLDVDGQEVFPVGFESKLIYAGCEVAPDDKFVKTICRKIKQDRIKGEFTDGGSQQEFKPYTANIYLQVLSNK